MTSRARIQSTGIHRSGNGRRGFRYRTGSGRAVSKADLLRIAALRIPTRWTEVAIARSATDAVQAVGRDTAGRWQYLYHSAQTARRAQGKLLRMRAFACALPALRRTLRRDLRLSGLPRDKALACAVAILATCFLRAGSEEYAEENASFGLATLRQRDVTLRGQRIRFDYRGKRGVRQRHEIANPRLASIVKDMLRLPGSEVFKYLDENGRVRDVSRWQVNQYLKRVMGRRFSARDFRTWAGTWICAEALRTRPAPDPEARERAILEAIRETSTYLGNTERVCRRFYVLPEVLRAFENGRVVACALPLPAEVLARGGAGLERPERALLELLERGRGRLKR